MYHLNFYNFKSLNFLIDLNQNTFLVTIIIHPKKENVKIFMLYLNSLNLKYLNFKFFIAKSNLIDTNYCCYYINLLDGKS